MRALADSDALAQRDRAAIALLRSELGEDDPILVPVLDDDVHDIAGLARIQAFLFAPADERERLLRAAAGL